MKAGRGRLWFVSLACCFILLAASLATSGFRARGASEIGQKPQKNPKLSTPLVVLSQNVKQESERPAVAGAVRPPDGFSAEALPKPLRDAIRARQMRVTNNGEVQVYIEVSKITDANLEQLRSFGVVTQILGSPIQKPGETGTLAGVPVVFNGVPTVQALLPVTMIEQVAALPFAQFVRLPFYGIPQTGSVNSQGDSILQANLARQQFDVDGTGVRVGVISDGIGGIFDPTNCGLSAEVPNPIQTDDLPSATPTCANGVLTSVSGGFNAQSFRADGNLEPPSDTASGQAAEGTAMLEIVHDLAPGAQLYFANFGTNLEFNHAVNSLAANADVVVDDIAFPVAPLILSPPFPSMGPYDGTDSVSANTSAALNNDTNPIRAYFTSVANFAQDHYSGQYVDSGVDGTNITGEAGHLHLFQAVSNSTTDNAGFGPSIVDPVAVPGVSTLVPAGGVLMVSLVWNDPFGASTNDYDLFLVQLSCPNGFAVTLPRPPCTISGTISDSPVSFSTDSQTGTQDPIEFAFYQNLTNSPVALGIVIQNVNNAAAPRTFDMFILGSLSKGTDPDHNFNTVSGSVPAESDAGGSPVSVVSVGAIDQAQCSPPGNCSSSVELYSGQGPTEATPQATSRMKPDIIATDGVCVTGAGGFGSGAAMNCPPSQPMSYTPQTFFGTSAAAPHAASIASLVLQALSDSTAGQSPATVRANLRNFLTSTAVPLPGVSQPVPNNIEGFGLLDALAAVKAAVASLPFPPPVLSAISPTSALAGSAAFTLSVSGSNFVSGSVINFNGQPQPTTFVSSISLTAAISASSVATAGSFSVTVTNPAPNGGTSAPSTFTVNNPLPALNSISPTSVAVGSPAFTLSLSGSNFNASSVVNFNAKPLSTTFVSATALTASIPATDVATTATDSVTVSNPAPGGGTSAAASFSVSTSDFVLNVAGSGNATITAGQTAIYKNAVSLTDVNGFSFSVVLSCSTNAPMSTCSTAPSTLTQGTNANIRVFTTQHGSVLPFANRWRPPTGILRHTPIWLFLMLAVLFLMFGGQKRRRRFALSIPLALVLLSIIFESACASNPTGGTSAGNYTVSVTGVSGTMAHSVTLNLTVK